MQFRWLELRRRCGAFSASLVEPILETCSLLFATTVPRCMLEQALPHLPHQVEQAQSSTETGLALHRRRRSGARSLSRLRPEAGSSAWKGEKGLAYRWPGHRRLPPPGGGFRRSLSTCVAGMPLFASVWTEEEVSLFFPLMEKEVLRRCRPQRVDLVAAPSMRCTPAGIVASFGGPAANARFHG